jgi:broad specificity phosphatase PhoE
VATRLALVFAIFAGACSPPIPPALGELESPPFPATVYVVRHAERSLEPPDDPHLSDAGYQRARLLVDQLNTETIAAILSTDTRRTRETAAPLAEAVGIPVRIYDPGDPASLDALLAEPALNGRAVLVVGHSNTVPGIVGRLSGAPVDPIDDDEYDRLYRLDRNENGGLTATLIRFGAGR